MIDNLMRVSLACYSFNWQNKIIFNTAPIFTNYLAISKEKKKLSFLKLWRAYIHVDRFEKYKNYKHQNIWDEIHEWLCICFINTLNFNKEKFNFIALKILSTLKQAVNEVFKKK